MFAAFRPISLIRYGASCAKRKFCAPIVLIVFALSLSEPARAEQVVIAALGDSLVHGYGLAPDDGFVPALERQLRLLGADVTIKNAGVSGDTTAGGLARIDWTLTGDVQAIIVALGGNDMLRGLQPSAARENLHAILTRVRKQDIPMLLVGLAAPTNFGSAYKAEFDAVYADLGQEFEIPVYPNFLAALEDLNDRQLALRKYMQPDAIHPNAKGIQLIVKDMAQLVAEMIKSIPAASN